MITLEDGAYTIEVALQGAAVGRMWIHQPI